MQLSIMIIKVGGEMDMYAYVWLSPFAVHLNYHNIVNWFIPQHKIKSLKKKEIENVDINKLILN